MKTKGPEKVTNEEVLKRVGKKKPIGLEIS